jgi:GNAT superfamily N-acetyltransferase
VVVAANSFALPPTAPFRVPRWRSRRGIASFHTGGVRADPDAMTLDSLTLSVAPPAAAGPPSSADLHHPPMVTLRLATPDDLPALRALIPDSVRALSQGFYTPEQIESAIRYVFGPDTQLIADGTYFAAEAEGMIAGCGGWSRRATLYGGDQMKDADDPLLDPATEAARIRAFFVHPRWARRGVGSAIMQACRNAAAQAGFQRLELMATLPGEPLYRAFGFEPVERVETPLPDGVRVPFVRMTRAIGG